jgi:hypothetical protein
MYLNRDVIQAPEVHARNRQVAIEPIVVVSDGLRAQGPSFAALIPTRSYDQVDVVPRGELIHKQSIRHVPQYIQPQAGSVVENCVQDRPGPLRIKSALPVFSITAQFGSCVGRPFARSGRARDSKLGLEEHVNQPASSRRSTQSNAQLRVGGYPRNKKVQGQTKVGQTPVEPC